MKRKIKMATNSNEMQSLYSQDWEYYDYGDCKRHLQIISILTQVKSFLWEIHPADILL